VDGAVLAGHCATAQGDGRSGRRGHSNNDPEAAPQLPGTPRCVRRRVLNGTDIYDRSENVAVYCDESEDPIFHFIVFTPTQNSPYTVPNDLGLSARSHLCAECDLLLEAFFSGLPTAQDERCPFF
jgi:hypothetical protein